MLKLTACVISLTKKREQIKLNGTICGYCYFSQYRKRAAYDRTAEVSVYLKPGLEGKRIGT
ncbi:MAG TPA: hypothetical protein VLA03_01155, partial [Draconibacterium sp.]|nr:hypothetical protein [Draconibacterium sp.]